jgi:hypothetical protein
MVWSTKYFGLHEFARPVNDRGFSWGRRQANDRQGPARAPSPPAISRQAAVWLTVHGIGPRWWPAPTIDYSQEFQRYDAVAGIARSLLVGQSRSSSLFLRACLSRLKATSCDHALRTTMMGSMSTLWPYAFFPPIITLTGRNLRGNDQSDASVRAGLSRCRYRRSTVFASRRYAVRIGSNTPRRRTPLGWVSIPRRGLRPCRTLRTDL